MAVQRKGNGTNGHQLNGHTDGVHGLSQQEGYALLDRLTQEHLNMSASDFIAAWRDGQFQNENDCPEAVRLAMMIPLAV